MEPAGLARVLGQLPRLASEAVLIGTETSDDAGAVRLPSGEALLATVDIIMPMADDPADVGAIAAANAVSDVYAMGGRPVLALSVVCFPSKTWPLEILGEMLAAGARKLAEVGVPVVGGHTIEDAEMKLGYSVCGLASPEELWRNSTARPGDVLVLTKPIGTGVLAAAARAGAETGEPWRAALLSMCALNAAAAAAVPRASVHAATDVTGFGLLGHAAEMARGAGVTLRLKASSVPLLPRALELRRLGFVTRAEDTNLAAAGRLAVEGAIEPALVRLLADPQTSGGLLFALDPTVDALAPLLEAGVDATVIGSVEAASESTVILH